MASGNKLTKKDLKELDPLMETGNEFLEFFERNKTILSSLIFALILGGGVYLFVTSQNRAASLEMESLYFQMTQLVDANSRSSEELIDNLKKIYNQFSPSEQKSRAGLLLANVQYQHKKYDDSAAMFERVLKEVSPGSLNMFLAKSGLAHSYVGKKEYQKAIQLFKEIVAQPGSFPLFYTYLELSRCYELAKDVKNAILILREMQNKFPNHAELHKVHHRLQRLEGSA